MFTNFIYAIPHECYVIRQFLGHEYCHDYRVNSLLVFMRIFGEFVLLCAQSDIVCTKPLHLMEEREKNLVQLLAQKLTKLSKSIYMQCLFESR